MLAVLEQLAPHHQELRKRLIYSLLTVILASTIAYLFIDRLADFCLRPLFIADPSLQRLVYTKLTDAFITYLKLSVLIGFLASGPVLLYHVWMFIAPGLLDSEKKLARQIIFWSSFLFLAGATFSYTVVLPRTLAFFMSYAGPNLVPLPKFGLYVSFVSRMILAFGIAFQIPFLMVIITRFGLLEADHFRKQRKYFYLAILILSFGLTAGDFVATGLLALPLAGLYEAGLLIDKILPGKGKNLPAADHSA